MTKQEADKLMARLGSAFSISNPTVLAHWTADLIGYEYQVGFRAVEKCRKEWNGGGMRARPNWPEMVEYLNESKNHFRPYNENQIPSSPQDGKKRNRVASSLRDFNRRDGGT